MSAGALGSATPLTVASVFIESINSSRRHASTAEDGKVELMIELEVEGGAIVETDMACLSATLDTV